MRRLSSGSWSSASSSIGACALRALEIFVLDAQEQGLCCRPLPVPPAAYADYDQRFRPRVAHHRTAGSQPESSSTSSRSVIPPDIPFHPCYIREWLWEVDDSYLLHPPDTVPRSIWGIQLGAPSHRGRIVGLGLIQHSRFPPVAVSRASGFSVSALFLRSSEIQVSRMKSRLHPLRSWMSAQDGEPYSMKMQHSSVIYITPLSDF